MANLSSAQAAAEIVALINSRVQSPRQDELEAIIDRVMVSMPSEAVQSEHRNAWDCAVAASDAANARVSALNVGDTELSDAEDRASAAANTVDECARRIFSTPVRRPADLGLVAEACFRVLWSEGHLADADAGRKLLNGPEHCVEGICAEGLAALLRGAHDLGCHRPDATAARVDDPIVKEAIQAVERWCAAIDHGDEAKRVAASAHLDAVARRIWGREPRSPADVVARAILLEHFTDVVDDDTGMIAYLDPAQLVADRRPLICDSSAEAHLLDAIRKVLGGRSYPRA